MNRIFKWIAASVLFAMSMNSYVRASQTIPVTLDGLNIDSSYVPTVTDPGTGVVFSNADNNGGGNNFIIDYFNAYPSLPDITPGRILSNEGFVGGGGLSAPADFGFTMTLPTPASGINMIMDYTTNTMGPAGSVLLEGYDPTGALVASEEFFPSPADFHEQPLAITSDSDNIVEVTLTPTNIFDNFGDITYTVPEPAGSASAVVLALIALAIARPPRRTISYL